jgi:hypothetical protein
MAELYWSLAEERRHREEAARLPESMKDVRQ